jgi:hypothetical protein
MSLKCDLEHVTYDIAACLQPLLAEPRTLPWTSSHFLNSFNKFTIQEPLYLITMLCRLCEGFSFKSIWGAHYEHQPSLMSLRESAAKGCELCVIICHALISLPRRTLGENQENTGLWLDACDETKEFGDIRSWPLRVNYGPQGNIESRWAKVYYATNEGLKECTTE